LLEFPTYHGVLVVNRCARGFHGINGSLPMEWVPSIYSMIPLLRS